jgi:hypothetical protein
MRESRTRPADSAAGDERAQRAVPGEGAEGDDDAQAVERANFRGQVRQAVVALARRRLVGRRRATIDRADVDIGEPESVNG